MSPLAPGDWVECINADGWLNDKPPIHVGAIYQVHEIISHDPILELPGCRLDGIETLTHCGWFGLHRFRPIYRPKQSLIESLRTVSRDQVLA